MNTAILIAANTEAFRPKGFRPTSSIVSACLVIGLALGIVGCATPDQEAPVVLTASDSILVTVLVDLHRLDARIFEASLKRAAADSSVTTSDSGAAYSGAADSGSADSGAAFSNTAFSSIAGRDSVLAQHGLTPDSFKRMIEERLQDPQRFLFTYNLVLDQAAMR